MTTGIIKQHHRRPFLTGGLHKGWIWNNLKQDNAITIVTLFWGRRGLREDFCVMLQSCGVSMLPTTNSRCVCSNRTPFETYYVTPVTRSPNAPINTITRGRERERIYWGLSRKTRLVEKSIDSQQQIQSKREFKLILVLPSQTNHGIKYILAKKCGEFVWC